MDMLLLMQSGMPWDFHAGTACCWLTFRLLSPKTPCRGPLCFHRATPQTATLCRGFFCVPGAGEIRTKCLHVVFTCACYAVFILSYPFPLSVCSSPRSSKILRCRTNIQSSLGSWLCGYERNANSPTEAKPDNILLVYNYQFFSQLVS